MALFFDAAWFDARLASLGLARATLAVALGLPEAALAEIWKDQRELSVRDVAIIAALLGTSGEDVAQHAGISTPVPRAASDPRALADIIARLDRIEQALTDLTTLTRETQRR
jgi:hypothetical protein